MFVPTPWTWPVLPLLLLAISSHAQLVSQQVPKTTNFPRFQASRAGNVAHQFPKILEADYVDLSQIGSISKFRSAEGHDYSDAFEFCRNMKHYFRPKPDADWGRIKIFVPATGVVFQTQEEWAGTKIDIAPDRYPAFLITIFHVRLLLPLRPGDRVVAGQQLGFHFGKETWSDIAVSLNTPEGRRLISYFEVMPDSVFNDYQKRGVASRDSAIISKEIRDSDPLVCRDGKFTTTGHVPGWIVLTPSP